MLHKKGASGVAQGVGPEFKPQCNKEKKKEMTSSHKIILVFGKGIGKEKRGS
jgi:hypothetical protein